jgi:hypothetical protein
MKDSRYLEFQAQIKNMSTGLAGIVGYDNLITTINNVADWDSFQAAKAQIETILWFKEKGILKEIEPPLPVRAGFADVMISFSQQDIFCEVYSLDSFVKSIESRQHGMDDEKIEFKNQKRPYLTRQDIEHEIRRERILRIILEKAKKQLPADHPGILVLETGKTGVYHGEIKEIAKILFPQRSNIILIMLWSLEHGSDIGEPPFWFINYKSRYNKLGQELLEFIKINLYPHAN